MLTVDEDRLQRAQQSLTAHGLDGLLIGPGPDLRYLVGYHAIALERLTCLVVPTSGPATLVVPELEAPAAEASGAERLGVAIQPWAETDDPYALVAELIGTGARVAVDDAMQARSLLRLAASLNTTPTLAGSVLNDLRRRKSSAEVAALQEAAAAIDAVHAAMGEWLLVGRTERAVAHDIAEAIRGRHETVDFVIVASGPNSASPHHEVSDRVIGVGDPVVVDIGGTTAAGYCSDSTRVYHLGEPSREYAEAYEVLLAAQEAGVNAAVVGATAESVDAAARGVLADAGLGEFFIHRTGHGIGVETHEHPYLVAGNRDPLQVGDAFSVEPGFYVPGRHGARIEDIVVCTESGPMRLNHTARELHVLSR